MRAAYMRKMFTGDEEEDAGCKRLVKPVEGGVVDEGHDADHDADEASQQGENHEGPGCVPVRCGRESRRGETERPREQIPPACPSLFPSHIIHTSLGTKQPHVRAFERIIGLLKNTFRVVVFKAFLCIIVT